MKMLEIANPARQVPTWVIMPADRPNEPIILEPRYTQEKILKALEEAGASK